MTETTIETLSGALCWGVRNGGEWARFFVRHGERPACEGGPSVWIDVAIRSSFGDWAHAWMHCGPSDWRLFLADLDRQYAMEKFMSGGYMVDDIDGTIADARRDLLERRLRGEITREEAREAWDACERAEGDGTLAAALETLADASALRDEFWERARTKPSPAAVGFWDQLWTPWVAQLAREALSAQQVSALSKAKFFEERIGCGWWALQSGWPATVDALRRRGLTDDRNRLTYSGERVRRLFVGRAA